VILRRIQSYEPDDFTVHEAGGSGGFSGAMPRILRACLGCGRSRVAGYAGSGPCAPYIRGHMGHRATPGEGHTPLVKRQLTCRRRRGVPRQDLQPVLLVATRRTPRVPLCTKQRRTGAPA
jgi:hypothetical protein